MGDIDPGRRSRYHFLVAFKVKVVKNARAHAQWTFIHQVGAILGLSVSDMQLSTNYSSSLIVVGCESDHHIFASYGPVDGWPLGLGLVAVNLQSFHVADS